MNKMKKVTTATTMHCECVVLETSSAFHCRYSYFSSNILSLRLIILFKI